MTCYKFYKVGRSYIEVDDNLSSRRVARSQSFVNDSNMIFNDKPQQPFPTSRIVFRKVVTVIAKTRDEAISWLKTKNWREL